MRTAAVTRRAVPRVALAPPRRLRLFLIVAVVAAIALGALYYGWFRDSSLVTVRNVDVVGLTGPDAERVRDRLEQAGIDMTTLHVDVAHLRKAVDSEPSIQSIRATPDFPHGLRVDVTENHPVAAVTLPGDGRVPIAGNGVLLPAERVSDGVPDLKIGASARVGRRGTAAARLSDDRAAALIRVAATAPPALLHRATSIERRRGEGIVVVLRDGPRVMFGDASDLPAKWRAAAGVLAAGSARGAAYVDVRLPARPVAGGLKAQPAPGGMSLSPGAAAPSPAPTAPSTPSGGSPQTATPAAPAIPANPGSQTAPATP